MWGRLENIQHMVYHVCISPKSEKCVETQCIGFGSPPKLFPLPTVYVWQVSKFYYCLKTWRGFWALKIIHRSGHRRCREDKTSIDIRYWALKFISGNKNTSHFEFPAAHHVQNLFFFVTEIWISHNFFFYWPDLHDIYGG